MRQQGWHARQHRKRTQTTRHHPDHQKAANVLGQDFEASAPNRKWVTDVTAIWTQEGWLYVAGVLDLYSRTLVGWAMAATQDEELVQQALQMALQRRHSQPGLLHHSDRGCQYTSRGYQQTLAQAAMEVSMSRTGNCYDNACMESFWSTLKWECIYRTSFLTRGHARQVIFEYIEVFYNRRRLHSSLGYVSPSQFEEGVDLATH
jgi:transposase InsO family protein